MKAYIDRVEPERYEFISEDILDRFNSREPDSIVKLAAIHRVFFQELSYHHSGSQPADPSDFFDRLSGDCQDHGTALATLYKAAGLQPALLRVSERDRGLHHILVEVKNPLHSIDEACASLRRFYYDEFNQFCPEIGYEKRSGDHWFVVDTAGDEDAGWSRYVGDITSHYGSCIEDKGSGEWDWYNLKQFQEV